MSQGSQGSQSSVAELPVTTCVESVRRVVLKLPGGEELAIESHPPCGPTITVGDHTWSICHEPLCRELAEMFAACCGAVVTSGPATGADMRAVAFDLGRQLRAGKDSADVKMTPTQLRAAGHI